MMRIWFPSPVGNQISAFVLRRDVRRAAQVASIFGIAAYVAKSARNATHIAAIWPGNGLLLVALLTEESLAARLWTAGFCYAANVIADLLFGDSWLRAFLFPALNIGEALLAFHLIRRWVGKNPDFSDWPTTIRFLLICGFAAPLLPSFAGSILATLLLGSPFYASFETWFLAHGLGLVVTTPACLVLAEGLADPKHRPETKDIVKQFALLAGISALVFGQTIAPILFLLIPVMVSIAFRLGPRFAAIASLLLTATAIISTYQGLGPAALIPQEHAALRVWAIQLFCAISFITSLAVATAVAERERLQRDLQKVSVLAAENRRELDVALDQMCQGLCLFDGRGRMVMRNDRFLDLYGLKASEVPIGIQLGELIRVCDTQGVAPDKSYVVDLAAQGDFDQVLNDGRHIRISQRLLADNRVVCTYTDITADKRSEAELLYRARHDALTGLANRLMLMERLAFHVAAAKRGVGFGVMIIDVDHFKSINDTYGHAAGDELLKSVATRLQKCIRDDDLAARLGGDEFTLLLANCRQAADAEVIARRVFDGMRQPMLVEGRSITVGLSMGIALAPRDGSTDDGILKSADLALYKAKQTGRNGFAFYDDWGSPPPSVVRIGTS